MCKYYVLWNEMFTTYCYALSNRDNSRPIQPCLKHLTLLRFSGLLCHSCLSQFSITENWGKQECLNKKFSIFVNPLSSKKEFWYDKYCDNDARVCFDFFLPFDAPNPFKPVAFLSLFHAHSQFGFCNKSTFVRCGQVLTPFRILR